MIYTEMEAGNLELSAYLTQDILKNKILSDNQFDEVISLINDKNKIDSMKGWQYPEPLTDSWGNRLIIQIFDYEGTEVDFDIISKGKDGILNTEDDLSFKKLKGW